jgi:hypothetical protein
MAPLDIAPQPVLYVPGLTLQNTGPLVVYKFMAGTMWDRQPRSAADLAALAEGWRLMNSVPVDGLWQSRGQANPLRSVADRVRLAFVAYSDWVAQSFPTGRPAAEQCLTLVEQSRAVVRRLDTCQPVLCFCRADPRFANVIGRTDGRIGFVDWEDSGLRDPARDLADVITHANQEDLIPPALWQAFLRPYIATRAEIDPGLNDRMQLYLALFPVFWLARFLEIGMQHAHSGRLASWSINSRRPNWRLRRYLARASAWPEADFSSDLHAAQALTFFPGID